MIVANNDNCVKIPLQNFHSVLSQFEMRIYYCTKFGDLEILHLITTRKNPK